jgi:5-methylcytosine-specific restriction endonuclease McrA
MNAHISITLRRKVRKSARGRCAYCRTPEELTVTTFEIDHIVPTSAGGATVLENLCLSCPACNRRKSARQSAPDPETGQPVPLFRCILPGVRMPHA